MKLYHFQKVENGVLHVYVPQPRSGGDAMTRMAIMWALGALNPPDWNGGVHMTFSCGSTVTYLSEPEIEEPIR
jgi:hypothetical protein